MVIPMKCLNEKCDATEIEADDNFCYKCGEWTAQGYKFLKDEENVKKITSGVTIRQGNRLIILGSLLVISIITFFVMLIIRGDDLFRPYFYIKKQINNYFYGYKSTLLDTNKVYNQEDVDSYSDAIEIIKRDFSDQDVFCFNSSDVSATAYRLEESLSVPSISFCDMSLSESKKIVTVLEKMYVLFPNIKGALTNITITNAKPKDAYIARFQPMYQFVNIKDSINNFNKVNKTQILLNSYYFLNDKTISAPIESVVGDNWYVNDATWESTIAHELGHYISFKALLNKYNVDNITFVTKDNIDTINNIIDEFNSGSYSKEILVESLHNYNNKYNMNLSIEEFALTISNYAGVKDKNNSLIYDETIAEAVHDYYLHGDNMKQSSSEVISVLISKL